MFDTFLKPVHEHLDEKGYFAPIPDAEEHMALEELGLHRKAIKGKLSIAIWAAVLAALACACVFWFITYLPFVQLYNYRVN